MSMLRATRARKISARRSWCEAFAGLPALSSWAAEPGAHTRYVEAYAVYDDARRSYEAALEVSRCETCPALQRSYSLVKAAYLEAEYEGDQRRAFSLVNNLVDSSRALAEHLAEHEGRTL